jgi:NADH-quinone oxidoreductase subunit N
VNDSIVRALTDYFPNLLPEALLIAAACVLFLGGTWRASHHLWGWVSLASFALAGLLLGLRPVREFTDPAAGTASLYAAPLVFDHLALLIRALSLAGGAVLVLCSWDSVPDDQAADYHACILIMVAGMGFTGMANELITLFLALELISIPTYVLLYLPRVDRPAQEAAMKYFLLSVFSSALLLFGFSYLYGLAGTTNLPALLRAAADARMQQFLSGTALVALVMVVAGLGFRITAVPFHFYAPDVYQGTTTPAAALLAFVPKVAGFVALVRVLGLVFPDVVALPPGRWATASLPPQAAPQLAEQVLPLGDQMPVLLWIVAAVTMTLGNLLALLQDNVKRMLAYSSVAHAGYMLIGLAVAPKLTADDPAMVGGVQAVLFYLVAYGAMTVGAFAILAYLSTRERPVETVDDLAGLARSHPPVALLMVLFLFSLIGIPLTAGFVGKVWLFWAALRVPYDPQSAALVEQHRLFVVLAVIAAINAAIAAWYYLRIVAVMYLREPLQPLPRPRAVGLLTAILVCAVVTLAVGIYPTPLTQAVQAAVPHPQPGAMAQQLVPAGQER